MPNKSKAAWIVDIVLAKMILKGWSKEDGQPRAIKLGQLKDRKGGGARFEFEVAW